MHYFLHHPRSTSFVAENGGVIVGFCIVDWKLESGERFGHFITIDVAPERRRAGLGRLLMQAGEEHLQGLGCVAMTLEVATDNADARGFYERLGYSQTGRIPGYYADGSDALLMRKSLASDRL